MRINFLPLCSRLVGIFLRWIFELLTSSVALFSKLIALSAELLLILAGRTANSIFKQDFKNAIKQNRKSFDEWNEHAHKFAQWNFLFFINVFLFSSSRLGFIPKKEVWSKSTNYDFGSNKRCLNLNFTYQLVIFRLRMSYVTMFQIPVRRLSCRRFLSPT